MIDLSVVLAVRNEEKFLGKCLESIKDIAGEIIVFDEKSTDKTPEIAKKYKAKLFSVNHEENFHITKQKAIEKASKKWILQLDADEQVSSKLAQEIVKVISMNDQELEFYESNLSNDLFPRHLKVIEARDGKIGTDNGSYTAFFIPRTNYFLGSFLKHGGVYPDGVVRLVKNGYAHFPCRSVHEQIEIKGRVGWLENNLLHFADESFGRYISRFNRYTDIEAKNVTGGFLQNLFLKPLFDANQGFLTIYLRHLGFLDGLPGFIWALFSALHFPIAYFKSIYDKKE